MPTHAKLTSSLPSIAVEPELRERVYAVAGAARVPMAEVIRDCILAALPSIELSLGLVDLDDLGEDELSALGVTRRDASTEDRAAGSFGWTPPA